MTYLSDEEKKARDDQLKLDKLSGLDSSQLSALYSLYEQGQSADFTYGDSTLSQTGTTIDPAVLALRTEGADLATTSLGNIQKSRLDTIGDPDTYVKRQTHDLRKDLGEQKTALETRLQKTGVEGEFGKQSMENFQVTAKQKLAQGKALALDEFNSLQGKFDMMEGGAAGLLQNIDMEQFAQDLQARGLSQELASKLTRLAQGRDAISDAKSAQDQQMLGNLVMGMAMFSSRDFKEDMNPVDNEKILDSMMELDVESWKYKGEDETYIGCYAEDFNKRFGEEGEKTISIPTILGVLMASIQAQQKHIQKLQEQVDAS